MVWSYSSPICRRVMARYWNTREVVEKPWGHQKIIDHSDRFKELLVKIGLEFEQREDVIRIWGYLPKDETDFPPQANFKPHKIFSDTWK
ncbi:DUF6678 family protein [Acinetobacter baumannii]|uniref:DUF6678 family protein n=1 Tax=Acinetobacter baumannii TaxID=470 RepID=UPI00338E1A46